LLAAVLLVIGGAAAQSATSSSPAPAKSEARAPSCDKTCLIIKKVLAARKNKFSGYRGKKITDESDTGLPEWISTVSLPGIEGPCEIHGGSEDTNNNWSCVIGTYASNDPNEAFAKYLGLARTALPAGWTESGDARNKRFSPPGIAATIMILDFVEKKDGRFGLTLYVTNTTEEE